MSSYLQALQPIKPATTDLGPRLGMTLFVKGSLRSYLPALEDLWKRAAAGLLRQPLRLCRLGGQAEWSRLPESAAERGFVDLFGSTAESPGHWELELATDGDPRTFGRSGLWLQLADNPPVRGMERLSWIRMLAADATPPIVLAALGEWTVNHLPIWWGTGGYVFHHTSGTMHTAHVRLAALAKRYWAVQLVDMTSLQWDGLDGMPGANWLTLLGSEFVEAKGTSLSELVLRLDAVPEVVQRSGRHGLAVAVGARPVPGDVNAGERLDSLIEVNRAFAQLRLTSHTPLFGPFARPETFQAWLRRFDEPQAWFDCPVSTD